MNGSCTEIPIRFRLKRADEAADGSSAEYPCIPTIICGRYPIVADKGADKGRTEGGLRAGKGQQCNKDKKENKDNKEKIYICEMIA